MPELSIYLLGPTQITLDGHSINFRTNKVQALLCYLAAETAAQPGIAFRREALMDLLWPEMSLKSAQDNLRQTLYQLRKSIPETTTSGKNQTSQPLLHSDRLKVELNPKSNYYLDMSEFHTLLTPEATPTRLEKAVELYRGAFLTDFFLSDSNQFEEWAAAKRFALQTQALDASNKLTSILIEQGKFGRAAEIARKQLEIDNLRESAHRQLMTIYFEDGRRPEALQQYEYCRQLLLEEVGVEPSAETNALYEQIRAGKQTVERPRRRAPDVSRRPRHNLPAQTTSFVGRQEELTSVINLLTDPDCRLLTLLGPGGIGKTRLSIQAASALAQDEAVHFPDGVFVVPMAAVPIMDYLAPAIADAMGFSFSGPREPKQQLLAHLKARKLLLVLDNLEHLTGESSLLSDLLTAVPNLTILVTSRARLNLFEEWQFELKGLAVPDENDVTNLEKYSAIQLFIQRAKQAGMAAPEDKELPVIAQICQLLAGMPLGIELAAGWVRTLTCTEIAAEIERSLDFLSTTMHNVPERHRSLHAVFEHSWQLLSQEAQQIFVRSTVFREGFTREAANIVSGAGPKMLAALVDNSMLRAADGRFYINELLRQYGTEKLKSVEFSTVSKDAYQRHAEYFADFLEQRESCRWSADELAALNEIGIELKNILAGWHWTITNLRRSDAAETRISQIGRYTTMLAYFYEQRNRYHEGIRLFEGAAAKIKPHFQDSDLLSEAALALAKVKMAEASLRFHLSQFSEVEAIVNKSLATFQESERQVETAAALVLLGMTKNRLGLYPEAKTYFEDSLTILQKLGERVAGGEALNGLGIVAVSLERFDEARQYLEAALNIYVETGFLRGIARFFSNLGTCQVRSGRYNEAMPLYMKALDAAREVSDVMVIAAILSNMGSISRIMGNYENSLQNYEESLSVFREMGERRWVAVDLNGMGETFLDMGRLDSAESQLRQSLEISIAIQSVPDMLDSLAALGQISAEVGDHEQAITTLTVVVEHPVTKPLARARCKRALAALKEVVSSTVWEEAKRAGQQTTLEELTANY